MNPVFAICEQPIKKYYALTRCTNTTDKPVQQSSIASVFALSSVLFLIYGIDRITSQVSIDHRSIF